MIRTGGQEGGLDWVGGGCRDYGGGGSGFDAFVGEEDEKG